MILTSGAARGKLGQGGPNAARYKLQVASYKLQVTSCKLQVASCKLQVASYKLEPLQQRARVQLVHT